MKRAAFYMVHFGKEYLAWAVRSVDHAVDEHHILFSSRPSHGHWTDAVCPETEQELRAEAERFSKKPVFWHSGTEWRNEGEHHDAIYPIAKERGIGQLLRMDADEIWDAETVSEALHNSETMPQFALRVWMVNFWRSFGWICHDPCRPHRIINPSTTRDKLDWEGYLEGQKAPVLHMGYAQSVKLMEYKMKVQSHHSEHRGDWLGKFRDWNPESGPFVDLHPTCVGSPPNYFWHAERTPPEYEALVKATLYDHPYFGMNLIP